MSVLTYLDELESNPQAELVNNNLPLHDLHSQGFRFTAGRKLTVSQLALIASFHNMLSDQTIRLDALDSLPAIFVTGGSDVFI